MDFQLPTVSEKHIAVIVLGIISVVSAWLLGEASVPIITGCAGSIGGFIAAGKID